MSILFFSVISFCLSFLLEILVIKFCHKHSLYDTLEARKVHTGNIPRLGGIAIALSFTISFFIYTLFVPEKVPFKFTFLVIAGFVIFFFGVVDDLKDLSAKVKLLIQSVASAIVIFSGFHFTQAFGLNLDSNVVLKVISYGVTFLWIAGIVNAYNLIDGLDGLCGSITFITFITYGLIFVRYSANTSAMCFILGAAVLGFLCFNWPPAKTFMGDNGSQFLGFMVAVLALYNEQKIPDSMASFEFNKILVVLNLTSLPVMDTIAAIWRRLRDHQPVMEPDKKHIHHKLMNIGFTKKQILFLLLGVQVVVCGIVYGSTFMSTINAFIVLAVTYVFMVIFFSWIHFANRAVNKRLEGIEIE